jgi:L-amino acid N-acyltransferase YncA
MAPGQRVPIGTGRFGRVAIARAASSPENVLMTGVDLRQARPGDAEAICAIYNAAMAERSSTFETEPRSARHFSERIEDRRLPLLVSGKGQGVIGWAGLTPYSTRACYAGIGEASVYVAPEARGRGVGTALSESLACAARERGFHKLIGKLFADNTAAIGLVERCGFSSVGVHRRHGQLDGEWRDVLVVERLLGETGQRAS